MLLPNDSWKSRDHFQSLLLNNNSYHYGEHPLGIHGRRKGVELVHLHHWKVRRELELIFFILLKTIPVRIQTRFISVVRIKTGFQQFRQFLWPGYTSQCTSMYFYLTKKSCYWVFFLLWIKEILYGVFFLNKLFKVTCPWLVSGR